MGSQWNLDQYLSIDTVSATQTLLQQTGLPSDILGLIWSTAIKNNDITFDEFAMAMLLAGSAQRGEGFPSQNGLMALMDSISKFKSMMGLDRLMVNQTGSLGPMGINPTGRISVQSTGVDRVSQPKAAAGADWLITPQEKQKYDALFKGQDPQGLGFIPAEVAAAFFSQSGLHQNVLAHIWDLADIQSRGKLNSEEFAVAMHLIYGKINGVDLPRKLPENLIPPSQRNLQQLSDFAKLDALHLEVQPRVSPAVSLGSLAVPKSQRGSTTSISKSNENLNEFDRADLIDKIEKKKNELSNIRDNITKLTKQANEVDLNFKQLNDNAIQKAKGSNQSVSKIPKVSTSAVDRFNFLNGQYQPLIAKCRSNILQQAEQDSKKVKSNIGGQNKETVVVNRAAQLLAERMAALGVKSSIPTPGAPSPAAPNLADELLQIEKSKDEKLARLYRIQQEFDELSKKLKLVVDAQPTLLDDRGAVKFDKLDVKTFAGRQLHQEIMVLKGLAGPSTQVGSSLPSTVNVPSASTGNTSSFPSATSFKSSVGQPVSQPHVPSSLPSQIQQKPVELASNNKVQEMLKKAESAINASKQKFESPKKPADPISVAKVNPIFSAPSATKPVNTFQPAQTVVKQEVLPVNETLEKPKMPMDLLNSINKPSNPVEPSNNPIPSDLFSGTKPSNSVQPFNNPIPIELLNSGSKSTVPVQPMNPSMPIDLLNSINKPSNSVQTFNHPFPSDTLNSGTKSTVPVQPMNTSMPIDLLTSINKGNKPVQQTSTPFRTDSKSSAISTQKPHGISNLGDMNNFFASLDQQRAQSPESKPAPFPGPNLNNQQPQATKIDLAFPFSAATISNPVSTNPSSKIENVNVAPAINTEQTTNVFEQESSSPFGPDDIEHISRSNITEDEWEVVKGVKPFDPFEVVVEFDYDATNDEDLTVKAGAHVTVVKESGDWYHCKNPQGSTGWVPKSFVKEFVEAKVLFKAKVLYDFNARNADELSCEQHQVVEVLDNSDRNWWQVSSSSNTGLVPSNFLRQLVDGESEENPFDLEQEEKPVQYDNFAMVFTPSSEDFPKSEELPVVEDQQNRKQAISELIQTEKTYLSDLKVVVKFFLTPMSQMNYRTDIIFFNILQVVDCSSAMLQHFETLDLSRDAIGSVFLEHLDDLECYKLYCENMSTAIAYLQEFRKSNPELDQFLKKQQSLPECKNLDLSSYLLIPMQRITRYSLLMRQVLHYTPKEHPHHDATLIALQLSDEFLENVNKAIKLQQSVRKIKEIARKVDMRIAQENSVLDLNLPTKYLGARIFLHEGMLIKNKTGKKLKVYLFNDMVLLTRASGTTYEIYRKPMMLQTTTIREAQKVPNKDTGDIDSSCFQLIEGDEVLTLRADNISVARQWINMVQAAIKTLKEHLKMDKSGKRSKAQPAIGTLECVLLRASNSLMKSNRRAIFAVANVDDQVFKSKLADALDPIFNFKTVFSVFSLDDHLRLTLYNYDKYSLNEYLGQAEIQLDFLEYYGGKQTEVIHLKLKDGAYEKVSLRLTYRAAQ